MKKATLTTMAIATGLTMGIAIGTGSNVKVASASDPARTVAEAWYEQLVTEGKNEATFKFDEFIQVDLEDIARELLSIDSPDTLFDGDTLFKRGESRRLYLNSNGEYGFKIDNGYDVTEADELTTKWANEILEKTGKNASDREKIYAMCDLVNSIYSYDHESEKTKDTDNFVAAYYGNRKIRCEQFSTVAYLIANKLGVDCKIKVSTNHAYNIVRLDNEEDYTILDLTSNRYGFVSGLTNAQNPGTYTIDADKFNELSAIDKTVKETINKGKDAKFAGILETPRQYIYYLTHGYSMVKTNGEIMIIIIAAAWIVMIVGTMIKNRSSRRRRVLK